MNIEEIPTDTAHESTPAPKAAKSNYGKPSKERRRERRSVNNRADNSTPANSRAGLKSTTDFLSLAPVYAQRPSAVLVDLHACNVAINAMIARMRVIAHRPLAALLADNARVIAYRKVCCYILFSRVCAAQLNASYTAGLPLDLMNAITAEELRIIDARCILLPNFFSWMLSQIGCFEIGSQKVIPTMPHPAELAVRIQDVLRGNYLSLCRYVQRHRHQGGVNIPPEDIPFLPALRALFPVVTHHHRFTIATTATFDPVVTAVQWDAFTEINGALDEQKCCTRDFKVSEAIGTEVPRVRFMQRRQNHEQVDFYSNNVLNDVVIRNALIVRLGMDVDIPENMHESRFIMNRNLAPLSGTDIPAPYIQAQLQMLAKLEAH